MLSRDDVGVVEGQIWQITLALGAAIGPNIFRRQEHYLERSSE